MRVQHQRTDALPLTWEVPATIALGWLLLAVVALPGGQGVAYALTGRGFAWPSDVLASLAGLLHGRPGIEVSGSVPNGVLIYASIAVVELILMVAILWVAAMWWRSAGPGTQHGLAAKHEVRSVLGQASLRRRGHLIRPDLNHQEPSS